MSLKLKLVISLFFLSIPLGGLAANSGCQCLCSIFYTRGGEIKVCPEESTTRTQCTNWYFEIEKASNKKDCILQGEDLHLCKGYRKEKTFKDSWTLTEEGRLHSCKFF